MKTRILCSVAPAANTRSGECEPARVALNALLPAPSGPVSEDKAPTALANRRFRGGNPPDPPTPPPVNVGVPVEQLRGGRRAALRAAPPRVSGAPRFTPAPPVGRPRRPPKGATGRPRSVPERPRSALGGASRGLKRTAAGRPRPALAGVPAAGRRRGPPPLGGSGGPPPRRPPVPRGAGLPGPPAGVPAGPPTAQGPALRPSASNKVGDTHFLRPSGAAGGPLGPSRPNTAAGLAPARVQVPRKPPAPFQRPGVRGVPLPKNL